MVLYYYNYYNFDKLQIINSDDCCLMIDHLYEPINIINIKL